jgi:hypothetical protein
LARRCRSAPADALKGINQSGARDFERAAYGRFAGAVFAGKIAKGEQLALSASDFGLEVQGEIAARCCGQKRCELFFQLPLFPRQRRRGQFGDGALRTLSQTIPESDRLH